MINARIVEFNNGKFGIMKTYKLFRLFERYDDTFYDLEGKQTWHLPKYVEEYCMGTFEEVVKAYLKLVEKELSSRIKNSEIQIKRSL